MKAPKRHKMTKIGLDCHNRTRFNLGMLVIGAMVCFVFGYNYAPLVSAAIESHQRKTDPNQVSVINPHWQQDGCPSCHKMDAETTIPIAPDQVDLVCLSCHNGTKARSKVHPIHRILPDTYLFTKPADWPLIDGKLGCLTCHDVKKTCDKSLNRPLVNPLFLRDRWAGNQQKFCQNCHTASIVNISVPHIMISGSNDIINMSEKNEIEEPVCLLCHLELLDRHALKRSGDPKLRSSQDVLCNTCHQMSRTLFNPGHMTVKISPETQAYMYAREILGPNVQVDTMYLGRLKESNAQPRRMVPDRQGNMTCTTCHNPHQEKVFAPDSEMAFQPMWLIGPSRVKSLSTTNQICIYCHN